MRGNTPHILAIGPLRAPVASPTPWRIYGIEPPCIIQAYRRLTTSNAWPLHRQSGKRSCSPDTPMTNPGTDWMPASVLPLDHAREIVLLPYPRRPRSFSAPWNPEEERYPSTHHTPSRVSPPCLPSRAGTTSGARTPPRPKHGIDENSRRRGRVDIQAGDLKMNPARPQLLGLRQGIDHRAKCPIQVPDNQHIPGFQAVQGFLIDRALGAACRDDFDMQFVAKVTQSFDLTVMPLLRR